VASQIKSNKKFKIIIRKASTCLKTKQKQKNFLLVLYLKEDCFPLSLFLHFSFLTIKQTVFFSFCYKKAQFAQF